MNTTYALADDVSVTRTEQGMVVLDEAAGRYYQVNESGAAVIEAVIADGGVDRAVTRLADRHGRDRGTVADDVERLLDGLVRARLVTT